MTETLHPDQEGYSQFAGPARIERELRTLEGILAGVHIDRVVDRRELTRVEEWIERNAEFAHRHPFNEIIPVLQQALADHQLTEDESADVLWLCRQLSGDSAYYDAITSDIQRLHGVIAGITADGKITVEELTGLRAWLENNEHLRKSWPYDEVDSVITSVLRDGVIDPNEHSTLLTFLAEFTRTSGHRAIDLPENWEALSIQGVCAVCPEMSFQDRCFCFTGSSSRMTRDLCAELIQSAGGEFLRTLSKRVHYLVIGAAGNPCWAYACYGRKVERAVSLRREGHPILLVHENDFWDAAQDAGVIGPIRGKW